ncbi:hypothetical protein [Calycomorphotria hydatis]|uniref:DUF4136 domain-containing protein n=1 Tax=Calycomorphotria hydatis TaxID=2528027 RepID=A0A517T4D8_9PLAN|nr:hypothetical protein [Calycomorphotria hydatis]QDT63221.1 hypothetical protein V22_04390 [Calycomorphotria hydatis]
MHRSYLILIAFVALCAPGCALFEVEKASNPIFISCANHEYAWERTVDGLHDYGFPIARENKLDGVIETGYRVGSGLLEPWNKDSVGFYNRLESSLQSIRRKARVTVAPAQGGCYIGVEAIKELEDVRATSRDSTGGASFQIDRPLSRDLDLVNEFTAPHGWIYQGRDHELEQALLKQIQKRIE